MIASMIALNTALGDIAVATSATQSQLAWIVDCYSVVLACLLLPAGAIGDRYGRRGAFLFGLTLFGIVRELQSLLACWDGNCPVCRRALPPNHHLRASPT